MIAQLRKKFILITMGSLILVLAVLMGVVNGANYVKMNRSADEVLQVLADNNGTFPDNGKHKDAFVLPDAGNGAVPSAAGSAASASSDDDDTADVSSDDDTADVSSDDDDELPAAVPTAPAMTGRQGFSAETPYETRFFSVTLEDDGTLVSVNTGRIAAVSTEQAVSMAQELQKENKTSGYEDSYKYLATDKDGSVQYVFLDCTRDLSSVKTFLTTSLLVSLFGILAVLALVVALSRRAIRPVAESYEKQKQFITNAGHEIKTPLAIIDSCTEVIEMEQGESKWTEGIRGQVKRLTALTQNLVSLARMDEGNSRLTMEDFSLSDAADEALAPFQLMAESAGLRLTLDLQPGIVYHGNEASIRQLCSILADNAVKYAVPGSEIRFTLKKKGRRPILTSENQAEGLTKGDQSMLFDRFYRGDASRSSEKAGYGIGLSMAQSIVTAHGGKISARSEDGTSLLITAQL